MRHWVAMFGLAAFLGCGKEDRAPAGTLGAIAQAAAGTGKVGEALEAAEAFRKERAARGDTIAMPYRELETYLPNGIREYLPVGDPTGQQQAMPGFSMSQVERTWSKPAEDGGPAAEIRVSLVDFGGTSQGYAMMAAPLMLGFRQEDDHHRIGPIDAKLPHTTAWEEIDKDSKTIRVSAVTRYRYLLTAEGRNGDDLLASEVRALVLLGARGFEDK